MGQRYSCKIRKEVCPQGIRVVQINGVVMEFTAPVKAKNLLLNYPDHFVCCRRDLCAMRGNNSRLLVGEEELQMGEVYLMLPFSALSSQDCLVAMVARLRTAAEKNGTCKNVVQGRAGNYNVIYEQLIQKCGNTELQMAYKAHMISKSRSWSPGLDTIKETCVISGISSG